jgi:hypothetical protein
MDGDTDLREQVLHIEARIEELADVTERCRKIILISKAAIAAGGTLILAIIIGAVGFDPTIMIGAIAAAIGGTVVFGSNMSTLKQTMTDMKAAEAHRTELISRMDLRVVGDGEIKSQNEGRIITQTAVHDPERHAQLRFCHLFPPREEHQRPGDDRTRAELRSLSDVLRT